MPQTDTKALRRRIAESKMLTDSERSYWLERLEDLDEKRMQKLEDVLARAENLQWNDQMEQYMDIVRRGQLSVAA